MKRALALSAKLLLVFALALLPACCKASNVNITTVCPGLLEVGGTTTFTLTVDNISAPANATVDILLDYTGNPSGSDVSNNFALNPPVQSGVTFTNNGNGLITLHVNLGTASRVAITYDLKVPCSIVPPTNSNGATINISQAITASGSGLTYLVNTPTTPCEVEYAFLADMASTNVVLSVPYGGSNSFTRMFRNTGTIDFVGNINLYTDLSACTGVTIGSYTINIYSAPVTGFPGGILLQTISNTTLPQPVTVPSLGFVEVIPTVSLTGCNSCTATAYLEWGTPDKMCHDHNSLPSANLPIQLDISIGADVADVVLTRINPHGTTVWDATCSGETTTWEYLIYNNGNAAANAVTLLLENNFANSFTLIQEGSVKIIPNDSRFPQYPSPANVLSSQVFTPYNFSGPALTCANTFPSTDPAIRRYQFGTINNIQLLPGQGFVLRFVTTRCCATSTYAEAMADGINYNRWLLKGTYQNACNTYADGIGQGASIGFTDTDGNPYTTGTLNSFNHWDGAISPNMYDGWSNPDLSLVQDMQQNNTDLTGGQGSCGGLQHFEIKNWSFPSNISNVSDYDTDLFTDGTTSNSSFETTGSNPGGVFRLVFDMPLDVDAASSHPPTITANNIEWRNKSWTQAGTQWIAEYDIDKNWYTQNNDGSYSSMGLSPWATSGDFRGFMQNPSTINFYLKACCPMAGADRQAVMVGTQFAPAPNGAACTPECFINLSQVPVTLDLHCPGCKTPGLIVEKFGLTRYNFDYKDLNDDGLPESVTTAGNLIPLDVNNYHPVSPVNDHGSIVGDTLVSTATARFQNGDDSAIDPNDGSKLGFSLACWKTRFPAATLNHLYIEQSLTNVNALGINNIMKVELIYEPHGGGPSTTYSLPITPFINPGTIYNYHIDLSTLSPPIVMDINDKVHVRNYYKVCTNPGSATEIGVMTKMYLSPIALTMTNPRIDYPPMSNYFNDLPPTRTCGDILPTLPTPPLWICEAMGGKHYVYPLVHKLTQNFADPKQCEKGGVVEVSYYIGGGHPNMFPYEFRMVPDIDPLLVDGAQLHSPAGPVKFNLKIPAGFTAEVKNIFTRANDYRTITNIPIPAKIEAPHINMTMTPGTFGPTDVEIEVTPNLATINYTPPYTDTTYNSMLSGMDIYPPAGDPTPKQDITAGGVPVLLLSDESFTQGLEYGFTAICSLATGTGHIIGEESKATIPYYPDVCGPQQNDIEVFKSNFHAWLSVPYVNIQETTGPVEYGANTITYPITLTVPAEHAASNVMVYFNPATLPSGIAFTSFGGQTGVPFTHNGLPYLRFELGTLWAANIAKDYTYNIVFTVSNCNLLNTAGPHNLTLKYSWNCDGYILSDPTLPNNNCFTPVPFTLNLTPLPIFLKTDNNQYAFLDGCSDYNFEATLSSQQLGGIGNVTATVVLPQQIIPSQFKATLNGVTCSIATPTPVNSLGFNTYTIDLTTITAFGPLGTLCSGSLSGPNGMSSALATDLKLSFTAYTNVCGELPPASYYFSGDYYCGITPDNTCASSGAAPCTFTTPAKFFNSVAGHFNAGRFTNCIGIVNMPNVGCGGTASPDIPGQLVHAGYNAGKVVYPVTGQWTKTDASTGAVTVLNGFTVTAATSTSMPSPVLTTPTGGYLPGFTYKFIISDGQGCKDSSSITIKFNVNGTATPTNPACHGELGSIAVNYLSGGTPYTNTPPAGAIIHYRVEWNGTQIGTWGMSTTVPNPYVIRDLSPGTYNVFLSVRNGTVCNYIMYNVVITEPPLLQVNAVQVQPACNTANDGEASVTATGGTAPYTYRWSDVANSSSEDLTGLAPGNYTVTVTDAHGCTATDNVTINPHMVVNVGKAHSCNDLCNGSITLNVTSADGYGPFSYLWSNTENTASIDDLCEGTYTYTVTDNSGCTVSGSVDIDPSTLIALSTSSTPVTCSNGNNGTATVNVTSGGAPPYQYLWSPGGQTTSTAINLTAQNYSVTVTDLNGCSVTSSSIPVTATGNISITADLTHVTCHGATNGAIDLTVTGASGPYTYVWANGNGNDEDLTNRAGGNYQVVITDATGCTVSTSLAINEPDALVPAALATGALCAGSSDGSVSVNITGGTPLYSYEWDDVAESATPGITGLPAGTYSVTVTDANGCTAVDDATVTEPYVLAVMGTASYVCWQETNGTITTSVTGGITPYEYEWSDNGAAFSPGAGSRSGFANGIYIVKVRDGNGCTATTTFDTPGADNPMLIAINPEPATTCSGNDGQFLISADISGGPYQYKWSTPPGGTGTYQPFTPLTGWETTVTGLASGTYGITVINGHGCTADAVSTVGAGDLPLSISSTNIVCFDDDNGTATATPTGGVAPYSYIWNDGSITPTIDHLEPGTYTVEVQDANGCTATASIVLDNPQPMSATLSVTQHPCSDNAGSLVAPPPGGVPPYSYAWSNVPQSTTNTASNLTQGYYYVTITDDNGCEFVASIQLDNLTDCCPTPPTPLCFDFESPDLISVPDRQHTFDRFNDTGEFLDQWEVASGTPSVYHSGNITDVDAYAGDKYAFLGVCDFAEQWSEGVLFNYNFQAGLNYDIDLAIMNIPVGQTAITPIDIDFILVENLFPYTYNELTGCSETPVPPPGSQPAYSINNFTGSFNDPGGPTWELKHFTITPASGNYHYLWIRVEFSTPGTPLANTTSLFAFDSFCAEPTDYSLTINETVTNIPCGGQCTGSITATIANGTSPYTYQWSNGSAVSSLSGLCPGVYTVTVTDATGCTTAESYTITAPAQMIYHFTADAEPCQNNTGAITLAVSQGTPPYSYIWNPVAPNAATINNLAAGTYKVTVTDANGCSLSAQYQLNDNCCNGLAISGTPVNPSCSGTCTAGIYPTVTGGAFPYSYQWSSGQSVLNISNLCPGTYTLTVTDANRCSVAQTFNVVASAMLLTNVNSHNATHCNAADGFVELNIIGGTSPYSYNWSMNGTTGSQTLGTGISTATITGGVGNYMITVTDANGCTTSNSGMIGGGIVLYTNTTGITCMNPAGSISIMTLGGMWPMNYNWSNGAPNMPSISGLAVGSYSVTVTDANGCSAVSTANITMATHITVSTTVTDPSCHGDKNGSILADAAGGNPSYNYNWSNGASGPDNNNLTPGTYTVSVNDMGGCSATATVTVTESPEIVITVTAHDATCYQSNGSISASASGGVPGYSYFWSNGQFGPNANFLAGGIYNLTVMDSKQCPKYASATVLQPQPPIIQARGTNSACNGSTGTATAVHISGGLPPFTYIWSDGQTTETAVNLAAGHYCVTITDANGCWHDGCIYIDAINNDLVVYINTSNPCETTASYTATAVTGGGLAPYSYEWLPAALGTGETVTGLGTGTYSVTATDANGCTGTYTTIIDAVCCRQHFEATHTVIDQDEINDMALAGNYIVWPPRSFISELITIPASVQVIDITNGDAVFAEEAGIVFQGHTILRANNSVFRPCEDDRNWRGLKFEDASTGQINTGTIKNAIRAVVMTTPNSDGVAINNTLFKNCIIGVYVPGIAYNEEITGNTFLRDDNYHPYKLPDIGIPFSVLENRAIWLENSLCGKMISGNSFVYNDVNPIKLSYGIWVDNSQADIAQNNFSNVFLPLNVVDAQNFVGFTDNDISYHEGGALHTSDVRAVTITNQNEESGIYIGHNNISYDHEVTGDASAAGQVAIYGEHVNQLIVLENTITGFMIGMQLEYVNASTIALNEISSFEQQGIYMNHCTDALVSMNDLKGMASLLLVPQVGIHIVEPGGSQFVVSKNIIRMNGIYDMDYSQADHPSSIYFGISNGIEYSSSGGDYNSVKHRIEDNCIFDTHIAMYFYQGNNADYSMPDLSNNYLYNYDHAGVYIENYKGHPMGSTFGDIGNNTSVPMSAGRNSFVSNFLSQPVAWGTAVDIFSTTNPIYAFGNSSNLVVNTNVQLLDVGQVYTSTTSCGNMVGNNEFEGRENMFDGPEIEDDLMPLGMYTRTQTEEITKGQVQYPVKRTPGGLELLPDFVDSVQKVETTRRKYCLGVLGTLYNNNRTTDLDVFYTGVINANLLDDDDKGIFTYAYLRMKQDYAGMAAVLNSMSSSDADVNDWVDLQKINLGRRRLNTILDALSPADILMLQAIVARGSMYALAAREELNAFAGNHPRAYLEPVPPHAPEMEKGTLTQGNTAYVYPNPFDNKFQLVYRIETKMHNAYATVTDVLGRVLITVPLENQNGVLDFDLTAYANGFYLLTVVNNEEKFSVSRIIKD